MTTTFTPNHELPYPNGSEPPRGDLQLEALAEATERALDSLVPDTGTRVPAPDEVTAGTGWELITKEYRAVGRRCTLHLQLKRTGAQIVGAGTAPNTSYNISGDPTVATIVRGDIRPVILVDGLFRGNLTSGSFAINPANGIISIYDFHYRSDIDAPSADGDYHSIQVYAFYPIAAPLAVT